MPTLMLDSAFQAWQTKASAAPNGGEEDSSQYRLVFIPSMNIIASVWCIPPPEAHSSECITPVDVLSAAAPAESAGLGVNWEMFAVFPKVVDNLDNGRPDTKKVAVLSKHHNVSEYLDLTAAAPPVFVVLPEARGGGAVGNPEGHGEYLLQRGPQVSLSSEQVAQSWLRLVALRKQAEVKADVPIRIPEAEGAASDLSSPTNFFSAQTAALFSSPEMARHVLNTSAHAHTHTTAGASTTLSELTGSDASTILKSPVLMPSVSAERVNPSSKMNTTTDISAFSSFQGLSVPNGSQFDRLVNDLEMNEVKWSDVSVHRERAQHISSTIDQLLEDDPPSPAAVAAAAVAAAANANNSDPQPPQPQPQSKLNLNPEYQSLIDDIYGQKTNAQSQLQVQQQQQRQIPAATDVTPPKRASSSDFGIFHRCDDPLDAKIAEEAIKDALEKSPLLQRSPEQVENCPVNPVMDAANRKEMEERMNFCRKFLDADVILKEYNGNHLPFMMKEIKAVFQATVEKNFPLTKIGAPVSVTVTKTSVEKCPSSSQNPTTSTQASSEEVIAVRITSATGFAKHDQRVAWREFVQWLQMSAPDPSRISPSTWAFTGRERQACPRTLRVNFLPSHITLESLLPLFSLFGVVCKVRLGGVGGGGASTAVEEHRHSFAFVEYLTEQGATQAIKGLSGVGLTLQSLSRRHVGSDFFYRPLLPSEYPEKEVLLGGKWMSEVKIRGTTETRACGVFRHTLLSDVVNQRINRFNKAYREVFNTHKGFTDESDENVRDWKHVIHFMQLEPARKPIVGYSEYHRDAAFVVIPDDGASDEFEQVTVNFHTNSVKGFHGDHKGIIRGIMQQHPALQSLDSVPRRDPTGATLCSTDFNSIIDQVTAELEPTSNYTGTGVSDVTPPLSKSLDKPEVLPPHVPPLPPVRSPAPRGQSPEIKSHEVVAPSRRPGAEMVTKDAIKIPGTAPATSNPYSGPQAYPPPSMYPYNPHHNVQIPRNANPMMPTARRFAPPPVVADNPPQTPPLPPTTAASQPAGVLPPPVPVPAATEPASAVYQENLRRYYEHQENMRRYHEQHQQSSMFGTVDARYRQPMPWQQPMMMGSVDSFGINHGGSHEPPTTTNSKTAEPEQKDLLQTLVDLAPGRPGHVKEEGADHSPIETGAVKPSTPHRAARDDEDEEDFDGREAAEQQKKIEAAFDALIRKMDTTVTDGRVGGAKEQVPVVDGKSRFTAMYDAAKASLSWYITNVVTSQAKLADFYRADRAMGACHGLLQTMASALNAKEMSGTASYPDSPPPMLPLHRLDFQLQNLDVVSDWLALLAHQSVTSSGAVAKEEGTSLMRMFFAQQPLIVVPSLTDTTAKLSSFDMWINIHPQTPAKNPYADRQQYSSNQEMLILDRLLEIAFVAHALCPATALEVVRGVYHRIQVTKSEPQHVEPKSDLKGLGIPPLTPNSSNTKTPPAHIQTACTKLSRAIKETKASPNTSQLIAVFYPGIADLPMAYLAGTIPRHMNVLHQP